MTIYEYQGARPVIGQDCFIADSADVIGAVRIGDGSSIWFGSVVRADLAPITIGRNSNIQDNCVVHVIKDIPTVIGDHVSLGHGVIIHAATIEDNCLIGMGAVVLDQAVIGHGSIIAAGTVVPPRMVIPPHSQVMGVPGKVVKTLDPDMEQKRVNHADTYAGLAKTYLKK